MTDAEKIATLIRYRLEQADEALAALPRMIHALLKTCVVLGGTGAAVSLTAVLMQNAGAIPWLFWSAIIGVAAAILLWISTKWTSL